jgi:hypothetical protein
MFRTIGDRVSKRVEALKTKTKAHDHLEKSIREFLTEEFGIIGETLYFQVSLESSRLRIWVENKTAANELAVRSTKLATTLKAKGISVKEISVA